MECEVIQIVLNDEIFSEVAVQLLDIQIVAQFVKPLNTSSFGISESDWSNSRQYLSYKSSVFYVLEISFSVRFDLGYFNKIEVVCVPLLLQPIRAFGRDFDNITKIYSEMVLNLHDYSLIPYTTSDTIQVQTQSLFSTQIQ
ncbi:Hypothetical_protein [Hexamita inflata]|uniref:Hypothetical_protein n=1 Tax=Hexamita inflata TaxID=28002 RepID=A0ABP1GUB6_9EUKA